MIKEDGEKYACESCVRGHRVSSCKHKDRPLTHINKKGRPVSQCQHCRGLRKNRATHVKCVCGELANAADGDKPRLDRADSQEDTMCPCMDGLRCTCALKKDLLDVDLGQSHARSLPKPAMLSRKSEPAVPKSKNGHHAPIHRNNNAAHEYGLPYQIPRYHTSTDPTDLHTTSDGGTIPSKPVPISLPKRKISRPSLSVSTSAPSKSTPLLPKLAVPSLQMSPATVVSEYPLQLYTMPSNNEYPLAQADDVTASLNNSNFEYRDFALLGVPSPQPAPIQHRTRQPLLSSDGFTDWSLLSVPPENTFAIAYAQSSSNASVEQPGLSRSSSGTASDNEDNITATTTLDFSLDMLPLQQQGPTDPAWGFADCPPASTQQHLFGLDQPSQPTPDMILPFSNADLAGALDYAGFNDFVPSNEVSGGEFDDFNDDFGNSGFMAESMSGLVSQGEWTQDFQYDQQDFMAGEQDGQARTLWP